MSEKDMFGWNKTIQEMQEKDKDTEWTWADEEPKTGDVNKLIRERLLTDDKALLEVINETIRQIENERDLKNSDGFRVAQVLLEHIIWVTDHKKSIL